LTNFIGKIKPETFIQVCVLSGCDYYNGVKNFGLKVGLKLFENNENLQEIVEKMRITEKFKSSITENFFEEINRIVSIFYYQTIYNIKEKKLLPLYSKERIPKDSFYKECFNQYIDFHDLYGPSFENFEEYCNGNLDMKTYEKEKDLESEKIILSYVEYYYSYLKVESVKAKNMMILEQLKHNKKEQETENENLSKSKNFEYLKVLENETININQITDSECDNASKKSEPEKESKSSKLEKNKENSEKETVTRNKLDKKMFSNDFNNNLNNSNKDSDKDKRNELIKEIPISLFKDNDNKAVIDLVSENEGEHDIIDISKFHQLGGETFDVNFLIKICEDSKKNRKNNLNFPTNKTGKEVKVLREGENINKMNNLTNKKSPYLHLIKFKKKTENEESPKVLNKNTISSNNTTNFIITEYKRSNDLSTNASERNILNSYLTSSQYTGSNGSNVNISNITSFIGKKRRLIIHPNETTNQFNPLNKQEEKELSFLSSNFKKMKKD